jgi:predicted RND superfamily exporter protein
MSSEPEWMKQIPNDVVCNYFWGISAVILIAALTTVAGFIYLMLTTSKMRGMLALLTIKAIVLYGFMFFLYVCFYLTCSRSLIDKTQ